MIEVLTRPEGIAAVAAIFSAIATGLAVWAAIEGPRRAAQLAESLRSQGESHAEKRRAKLNVFAVLMANRESYWSGEPLHAFNLIDVVFNDVPSVRTAWSEMFLSFAKGVPEHVRNEKLRALLSAMARDLNLADELRVDDFGRVYRPEAAAQEQAIAAIQRQRTLATLMGGGSPSANAAGPESNSNSLFPPKPE